MKKKRTAAKTVSSSSSRPPPWVELPGDVTANILQRLGAKERLESAQLVCTTWRKVCLDPSMWRVVELVVPDIYHREEYDRMCRCLVDRSQGQLIDLRIVGFGDAELLQHIVDRSNYLQRITIVNCCGISGTALSQAVKRLPLIEELNLITVNSIRAKDIEAIGVSCPTLKSFSLHSSESPTYPGQTEPTESKQRNKYALAIGKTMPNLRHLQLIHNRMKNKGLEAVLDGCPHLESLDIRRCSRLNLSGDLGKRISQQIKNMRRPSDSISKSERLVVGGEPSDILLFPYYIFGDNHDDDYVCFLEMHFYGHG